MCVCVCVCVCMCADPWEHVLWMCAGSVTASYAVKQEAELVKRIEEKVASAKADSGKKKKTYTGPNLRTCRGNLMAIVRETE